MLERRAFSRIQAASGGALPELNARSGNRARLLDVSFGGALLESSARVSPGAAIELTLVANDQPMVLRAAVARCQISALHPRKGPRYRAGVMFDRPLDPAVLAVLRETPTARVQPC